MYLLQWKGFKKKRNEVFFFPILKNEEDKTVNIRCLFVFNLNHSWLWMSVTKLAFLPSNAAGATLHTYFPLTLCYIHSLSGVYPSNTPPLVVRYQKEGHRATQTARLSDWAMMSAGDCLWERSQDRNTLVPHHRLLTSSPHLIEAPRLLMGEEGHSSWGVSLLCSPFCQLRIKAIYFLQTLSPYVLFHVGGQPATEPPKWCWEWTLVIRQEEVRAATEGSLGSSLMEKFLEHHPVWWKCSLFPGKDRTPLQT